jgi:hypothetical protein
MLLGVYAIWVEGCDLFSSVKEALNELDALHEGVILVAHLVFPQTESTSRVDPMLFEERYDLRESLISMQSGRGIAVASSIKPS